ncbi:ATP-binding protein [Actinokineospora globicatena]|uniref:ATP-binding protein n=1 Tax=Actinokineospora globicatena TaxID=103729 RepID=UPI0020A33686|nr:tetratricopeptide repeat protein [Actinokineospora globicatena]GLW78815.1 hypothetical protein Aglo01_32970 [Actinokineospora globicatena]GLW84518.1 hypothetical protein Aglo02_21580 [Actinokineospora globicatena]
MGERDRREDPVTSSSSEVSGSAHDVVQANAVHGDIHFHGGHTRHPVPSQLPGDVSGFVNRGHERRVLDAVLDGGAAAGGLYVITGTAGVGKTSLALHWAHSVRRHFPDGQLYVNLRGYDPGVPVSAAQALDRFLRALGLPRERIPNATDDRSALFRSLLADRRVLLVLDNAATVSQVRPLLPATERCLVLITSRSRLSGLVARDGAHRLLLDMLSERDAVDLLRAVTSGYRSPDKDEDLVELARLCARLPLALRIAAERASSRPLMPLRELIEDLRDESALWDALTVADDDESDAVRTVFAWSYRALPEQPARLFRLLGLHPGPEFGTGVAAALAGTSAAKVRRLLDSLVGAHVLEQHAQGRFQFHDLLRVYAAQQAVQQETEQDRAAALGRALDHYLHTLAGAIALIAPLDRPVPLDSAPPDAVPEQFGDRDSAFAWYEREQTNLVSAVRSAAAGGRHDVAWRTAALLRSVYVSQNPFDEWFETARIGLSSAQALGDQRGVAELLDSLGKACLQSQRLDEAAATHTEALRVRREIGDRYGEGVATNALGLIAWRRRALVEARRRFAESLVVFDELADTRWQALVRTNIGMADYDRLDLDAAAEALREAVRLCEQRGDRAYTGNALFYLAMPLRELGELDAARAAIDRALVIAEEDALVAWGAFWLLELARIRRAQGDPGEALAACQRSAVAQRQIGDRNREAAALDGAGEAYRDLGRFEDAAKFHRRAIAIYRDTGDRWLLANALANLIEAMRGADAPDATAALVEEASVALRDFDDPRVARLRLRLVGDS